MANQGSSGQDSSRGIRRAIGLVAVVIIAALTVLLYFGLFLEWVVLVLLVWLVANYALRRAKRQAAGSLSS